jgi:cytochrome c5
VEEQSDSTFIRNISIVIGLLVIFAIVIIFVARDIGFQEEQPGASSAALTGERIKPVAGVYTGEAGAAAIEQAAATTATEGPAVAFDGSLDAEMIYNSVCGVCHATGAAEAPIPGTDAMAERTAKGMDVLVQSAVNGLNAMPARGGRPDLSDEQIQAVVEFMMQ